MTKKEKVAKVKSFLDKHDVPNDKKYGATRMFLTDRAQYPTKMPMGWGRIAGIVCDRWDEFEGYVEDGIDYDLMESLGIYGA